MKKGLLLILFIFIIFYLILYYMNDTYYEDNKVPIMNINLKNTTIDYINKHDKDNKYYDNEMIIINNGKKEKYSNIIIKGRGNYTWNLDKKPYQITFEEKTSILGLPKSKKFILLANTTDYSLLKNDFSYNIAKKMNLNYSFTGKFIDLYANEEYVGNYYITPKISISKSIVNLNNDKAIIMELDNSYYDQEKEEDVFVSDTFNDHLVLKDSNSDMVYEDMEVFKNKYNLMESAIKNRNYNQIKDLIDIDSFAKYYIISEFAENSDALRSSLFFYMDGYDDKIHIGPIWDCDIGYGLKPQYSDVESMPIFNHNFDGEKNISVLFYELLQNDEFMRLVKEIWNDSGRDIYKEEIKLLDKKIESLNKAGSYNNRYWKLLEYVSATSTLKKWIQDRYKYFNQYMSL